MSFAECDRWKCEANAFAKFTARVSGECLQDEGDHLDSGGFVSLFLRGTGHV